jgi:ADP-ribose pyrophosphatase YjhB (NUDIX family)
VSTAPDHVRFCPACGESMTTTDVHGTARRVCTGCRSIHYVDPKVAVGVAVFRDDRLLLVRRVMEPGRGRWTVPGGYLDVGEDPRSAAAREVAEEAGIEVEVGDVLEIFANSPEDGGTLFVLFAGRWLSGEPTAGDDADDAGFFGRDELPPLAFSSTAAAVTLWPSDDRPRPDAVTDAARRALAITQFNATWELVELPDRTPEQALEMVALACSSRSLWETVGTDENLAIADWQVAHVASLAGWPDVALAFATAAEARARTAELPTWLRASTCEGMARAHAAAGNAPAFEEWSRRAAALLERVADEEDRELVAAQLASIPPP